MTALVVNDTIMMINTHVNDHLMLMNTHATHRLSLTVIIYVTTISDDEQPVNEVCWVLLTPLAGIPLVASASCL